MRAISIECHAAFGCAALVIGPLACIDVKACIRQVGRVIARADDTDAIDKRRVIACQLHADDRADIVAVPG